MLGKLMKHEFRATGRIALPLCGIMMALSIVAGMVIRFWEGLDGGRRVSGWQGMTGSIIIILYGMSIFAVAIGIFVVLMQHFKRNLLGDEGYLMRMLPASVHELLLSKLFVALLWYLAAGVLIALSVLFVALLSGMVATDELAKLWDMVRRALSGTDAGFWTAWCLGSIGGTALCTLLFYADFALSQTFRKHKVLYNIAGVVIFIVLLRLLFAFNGFLDLRVFGTPHGVGIIGSADGPTEIFVTRDYVVELLELYAFNIGLYFLTWAVLKFRPNLE